MNRNKYVRDYTDAIKNLLPQMTEDEGNGILSGKLKIDSFLEELEMCIRDSHWIDYFFCRLFP